MVNRHLEELRLAVVFLTRLPVGRLSDPVPDLSDARWAFPVVGLLVGGITALVWMALSALGASPLLAATLTFGAQAMVTGALHHDGLADVADGLGGGRDRAHALDIMRDSRLGSYGALALAVVSLAWVVALADTSHAPLSLLALAVASRMAMLVVLTELPSAREDGLGQSASTSRRAYGAGLVLTALLMIPLGVPAIAALLGMTLTTAFLAHRALMRIGGQTGDVCGATQLLSETGALVALSMT
ncbi:adenosylcobinamide-GDP ribazoletransferase [Sagittula marina]|uniref:Adenosylcobinamide-GDP ribazoletransferase n=1 Tax=Sagittula marina TaxID=943940 RepID=A0A7W6DNN1_9RHOB|nr:adenosylcobinamide-GDP ribazoletransferase [Sagittula marina]